MDNLVSSDEPKNFYLWINPKDIYAMHNAKMGSFVSVSNRKDNLMFLPNPDFSGYISPFQENLLKSYLTEYQLETIRIKEYKQFPSRLLATFLFENEQEAKKYMATHDFHVGNRELKVAKTSGAYFYSKHDLSWIDFLRSTFITDEHDKQKMIHAYWKGESVDGFKLELMEKPLMAVAEPVWEILFLGKIEFEK